MKIDESQIKLIRMDSHGTAPWQPENASNGSVDNTIQTLQKSMSQNPQIMEMIQTLQNDPEIQSLIQERVSWRLLLLEISIPSCLTRSS